MPPTQHLKALRISPANSVTGHATAAIVSDTGSIAGVGSSLLWVKHGYVNSGAEIIATTPDTKLGRSHDHFKHLRHSGGTTISSKGTLHNVTMDGTRDWLVRSACMIFHSGLTLGASPKQLSRQHFDLVSGRGNFYIDSYNAQITEVSAGHSFYVDKTALLAVEYDQNSAFEVVGNKPYRPALMNAKDTLDVSPVTSILETSEIPREFEVDSVKPEPTQPVEQIQPQQVKTTHTTDEKPHYYLYKNRWWITMSKLSRRLVHRFKSIPSSIAGMFRRSGQRAASAAKNAAQNAASSAKSAVFSRKPKSEAPQSSTLPRPSLVARIRAWIGSYTNPNPFQSFVHIRGPTKVVVGQMHMPEVKTLPNDLEPYITEPELPAPITFAPQTHDYLKIAEVINGRVVFRSVPNFSTYNGVNGA
ncbi:hypothetical protein CJU89_4779 [Yarrowia sp. B02]|nr:hypothetical protein CJU89_4779 [Yarrowia sp. B02]